MQSNTVDTAKSSGAVAPVLREALRPKDAARFLGCSRATLHRLIAGGELKPRKLGRATLIMTADLRALLDRAEMPGAVKGRVVTHVA
jgi:excisionase family DNA binding protein